MDNNTKTLDTTNHFDLDLWIKNLIENQKPLEPEFQQIIEENIWELYV